MGIRFTCPNGHRLNVKSHLAGKRGICPLCGAKFVIPAEAAGTAAPPRERGQIDGPAAIEAGSSPQIADVGSQSIVIAVTDAPAAQPQPPRPEPAVAATPEAASTPVVVTEPVAAAPSVDHFAMRRERRRRQQLKIAIGLLTAVIVLALLLIWVLSRDAGQAARGNDRGGEWWVARPESSKGVVVNEPRHALRRASGRAIPNA